MPKHPGKGIAPVHMDIFVGREDVRDLDDEDAISHGILWCGKYCTLKYLGDTMDQYKYLYSIHQEVYKKMGNRFLDKRNHLGISEIDNAILLPVKPDPRCLMGVGGVLDSTHHYVSTSGILSRAGVTTYPEKDSRVFEQYVGYGYEVNDAELEFVDEDIVYVGFIFNHWGHFLIDFCTRLWAADVYPGHKLVFITYEKAHVNLHDNIWRFMELLGIDLKNVLFINQPTKFKKVFVPECAYQTNSYYSDLYLDLFEKVARNAKQIGIEYDKVYFARTAYKAAIDKEIGEESLVNLFKTNGYTIVFPEHLSLDEQIEVIRNSSIIAGITGSVTHNMLFAKPEQKLILLNKTYIKNVVQSDVNILRQLNTTYIDCFKAYLPVTMGFGPFLISVSRELEEFCIDNGFILIESIKPHNPRQQLLRYKSKYEEVLSTRYHTVPFKQNIDSVHYFNSEFTTEFESIVVSTIPDNGLYGFYQRIKRYTRRRYNKIPEKISHILKRLVR